MKRCFDVVVSVLLLIVLAPVLALVACSVWCDDPGPIIFRQLRVGRYDHPFYIFKFRTMRQQMPVPGHTHVTAQNDPRVTRVGKVLRATKLDEFPQLINVLRGEMSLVGPRPESPRYVSYYTPEQREVLNVRPGITGPASIVFRHQERLLAGAPDVEEYYITTVMPIKIGINLEYVRNYSFWRDVKILALTVVTLIHPLSPPPIPPPPARVVPTGYAARYPNQGSSSPGASGSLDAPEMPTTYAR